MTERTASLPSTVADAPESPAALERDVAPANPLGTAPLGMAPRRKLHIDSRYVAPLLISLILLGAQLTYGVLESYPKTLLAIIVSMVTEVVLSKAITGKWPHLASAYVSGISIGILVRSPEYWPFALCAIIAITSKYVIRVKGRHIWNPSNFAIAVMLLLAPEAVSTLITQWDNRPWAMLLIWAAGSYIIWNLKRFHICVTYVASFFAFALLRCALLGDVTLPAFNAEIGPITGPMYQLFIFFMITDPKTTVKSRTGQCAVAFAVAAAECVLRLNHNLHAPYYALFIVGPMANLLEIWWTSRRANHADVASSAVAASS